MLLTLLMSVAYLPQTASVVATPSPLVDFLAGLSLVLGSMVLGRIIQWILKIMQKAKKGIVGGGIR